MLKAINSMVDSGELKRTGKGMKGDPFLYSMGQPNGGSRFPYPIDPDPPRHAV